MIFLEPEEQVLMTVRKHWLFLFKEFVILAGLVTAPLVVIVLYNVLSLKNIIVFEGDVRFLWAGLTALWLLYCLTLIFMIWTDYYLDILVVTNKRVFDVEQRGLFFRDSSTFRLDKIQDITVMVSGVWGTFMNFGDIHIQTAGDAREFIANYIPNPFEIKRIISEQHDKALAALQTVRFEEHRASDGAPPTNTGVPQ